eukprot:scaffold99147_cov33-Phaeocystis_antarctica.AAC.1
MSKTGWLSLQLAGSLEAPFSAKSRFRLPKLRPASANLPLGPRWPAISGLFSTKALRASSCACSTSTPCARGWRRCAR